MRVQSSRLCMLNEEKIDICQMLFNTSIKYWFN